MSRAFCWSVTAQAPRRLIRVKAGDGQTRQLAELRRRRLIELDELLQYHPSELSNEQNKREVELRKGVGAERTRIHREVGAESGCHAPG